MASERPVEVDIDAEGEGPLRLCVSTRRTKAPSDLIRFVADPAGSLVADLAHRLPGRGVWADATHAAVASAVRTRAFARSLKRNVSVPADLADVVERLMAKRLAEAISLANKAGQVLTGFTKVEAAISGGEIIALLHGSDAAADGRQKLDRKLFSVLQGEGRSPLVIDALTIHELSLAIGRENVVHAALREGGAARRIIAEAERLVRYRSDKPVP